MQFDYKVRCDKHAFAPYDYCEMCMIRTNLQEAVEENRKMTESACASMQLAISVIHDMLDKLEKQIKNIKNEIGYVDRTN